MLEMNMHPVFFRIGDFKIHWYGVMMALGCLSALACWTLMSRKEGRNFNFCSDLLFWCMVSGILGARLAYVASDLGDFLAKPWRMLFIWQGGLIYYGGFLGAGLGVFLFARFHRENIWALCDFVVIPLPLAHALGRIGCFLNGCCYGKEYDSVCAVIFPERSYAWYGQIYAGKIASIAPHSLPMHPVQLYEAAFNFVFFFVLISMYRRKKRDGIIMSLYLLTYPLARFCFEFLRSDERMRWMGFSVAQWLSIGLILLGCWIWWWTRKKAQHPLST